MIRRRPRLHQIQATRQIRRNPRCLQWYRPVPLRIQLHRPIHRLPHHLLQTHRRQRTRAKEIVETVSHKRPNGEYFYTVLDEVGVSYTDFGENIAFGQWSAEDAVAAWISSDGHRANMLNPYFVRMGFGYIYDEDAPWGRSLQTDLLFFLQFL